MVKDKIKAVLKNPNSFTMFRVIVAPFIVLLMTNPNRLTSLISSILFGLAAISDYFDGYLARRYGMVSNLGKIMDPVADKMVVSFVLIILSSLKWIPVWIACVIVGRELAVTGLRNVIAQNKLDISASKLGKYKTGFQIASLIPLLIHFPLFGLDFHAIGMAIMWLALFFTILSGIDYFIKFRKLLNF